MNYLSHRDTNIFLWIFKWHATAIVKEWCQNEWSLLRHLLQKGIYSCIAIVIRYWARNRNSRLLFLRKKLHISIECFSLPTDILNSERKIISILYIKSWSHYDIYFLVKSIYPRLDRTQQLYLCYIPTPM